ncbi:hypothetical protein GCM10029964_083730 [Kibdelosporangium lantanae]
MTTVGLSVSVADDGGLVAKDGTGAVVFRSARPGMWDTTADGQAGAHQAPVGLSVTGDQVRLVPDQNLLTAADTRFPVEIDPDMGPNRTGWTSVFAQFDTTTYWNGANLGSDARARVGYSGDWEGDPVTVRSYFRFDVSPLFSADVVSRASFDILENWTPSCTPKDVGVHETGTIDPGTSWRNQPWIGQQLERRAFAHGRGSDCPADFEGFNVLPAVLNSVNNDSRADITIMLKAVDEGDKYAWKKFDPNTATVTVTYNRKPAAPTALSAENGKPCALSPNQPAVATTTPALRATLSDPDGDKVKAEYEWYLLGGAKVGGVKSTLQPTGTAFAQRIPSGAFKDGQTIHWRVRGIDTSDLAGPWSGWCDLTVDTTRPDKAPTVLSYDYPERELNGSIGKTGWFHLDANGVTDVDGFYFDLQDGASRFAKANKAGGWVDVPVTPPDFGPFTLWVYSADKAGNRSVEPKKYEFLVGRGWQPVGQWRMEGTEPDAVAHDGSGKNHDGTFSPTGVNWVAGRIGEAVHLNGSSGFVDTGATPAVSTTGSFSVAAWVKLDQATSSSDRTVVSQGGNTASTFSLGYTKDGKWRFRMPQTDVASPTYDSVTGKTATTAATWTHVVATYDNANGAITLYVNGRSDGASTHHNPIPSTKGVLIGADRNVGSTLLPGAVDDVKVFDRVLNPEEVGLLAGSPAKEQGRWLLDEGKGAIGFDESNEAHNLALTVNTPWGEGYDGEGSSLHFDGDAAASATTNQPVVHTDGNYTVSADVRITTVDTTSRVAFGQDGAVASGFTVGYDGGSKSWQFTIPGHDAPPPIGGSVTVLSPDPATAGEWAHLTAVRDVAAQQMRFYVNGNRAGIATTAGMTPWSATGPFRIGRTLGTGVAAKPWLGDVDNVRVYEGIRTDDQIREEAIDPTRKSPDVFAGQFNRWFDHNGDIWMSKSGAPAGYMFAGSYGLPAPEEGPNTRKLYSCRMGGWDEFTSVAPDCEGNEIIAELPPVYTAPPDDVPTLPLYRCLDTGFRNQHFNANDAGCLGKKNEALLGYTRAYAGLIRSVQPESPNDHWAGSGPMRIGNRVEGRLGYVSMVGQPGQVSLWACVDGADEFVSKDDKCEGKTVHHWIGGIWTERPGGTAQSAPIYSCRTTQTGERFVSVLAKCEGNGDGELLGYVITAF